MLCAAAVGGARRLLGPGAGSCFPAGYRGPDDDVSLASAVLGPRARHAVHVQRPDEPEPLVNTRRAPAQSTATRAGGLAMSAALLRIVAIGTGRPAS